MKSLFPVLFVFCTFLMPALYAGEPVGNPVGNGWRHARLTSTDGTQISIDFKVVDLGDYYAYPLWVNVTLPVGATCDPYDTSFTILVRDLREGQGWLGFNEPFYLYRANNSSPDRCHLTGQWKPEYQGLIPIRSWDDNRGVEIHHQQQIALRIARGYRLQTITYLQDPLSSADDNKWFNLDLWQVPENN